MKNILSKLAAVLSRTWAMPRGHKLIVAGIAAFALFIGIEVEPAKIDAVMTMLVIAADAFAQ